MRTWDFLVLKNALDFTASFGFLTRDIFFNELCPKSRARKYENWQHLFRTGLFYESRSNKDVLHLTKKGFSIAGPNPVRRRPSVFIPHDSHVGKMWLALKQTAVNSASWTEGQLKQAPWEALGILGSQNLEKIPDLVFELRTSEKHLRIAIEVEATRKSKLRYDEMALTYARMSKIDLITFVCEDRALEIQVTKAFDTDFYRSGQKVVVTTLLEPFRAQSLECEVRIGDRHLPFNEVISRALMIEQIPMNSIRDEYETGVSYFEKFKKEAA